MDKRKISFISLLLVLVLAGTMLASCGSGSTSTTTAATSAPSSTGSTSDGQDLMQARCSVCHSVSRIKSAQKTAEQWKTTVGQMIGKGAKLNAQEEQTLVDYLAENYK